MLRRSLIMFQRALVLCAIVGLALFTTFGVFPFIQDRTPLLLTLLLSYGTLAYVVIPLMIRLLRLIIKPNHVPTHATTGDGWASDPVNIALTAASKRHFVRAFRRAGWHIADEGTLTNLIREGYALLLDRPYPTAPCSRLYLFGRPQDVAFEMTLGKSPRCRHHVRFWRVDPASLIPTLQQRFWWQTLKKMVGL